MPVLKLTKRNIDEKARPVPGKTQVHYWDPQLRGFGLVVGQTGVKTFVLQKRNHRMAIGRTPPWTPDQARARAGEMIRALDTGQDPLAARRGSTLREAIDDYVGILEVKRSSPLSIAAVRDMLPKYLADWLPRPIASISKREAFERHRRVSEVNGPGVANVVFRWVRAVYNSAATRAEGDLSNPCKGVVWNHQDRVQSPLTWDNLSLWRARIEELGEIHRDYLLTVAFTGLRAEDAATIRWPDVDLEAATLKRPSPKGGPKRGFTIPIAQAIVEVLRRRRERNQVLFPGGDGELVFPARSREGAVIPIPPSSRPWGRDPYQSPHRLRDTFATAAKQLHVDTLDLKVLLNHRPPGGDVTEGYVRQDIDHLRHEIERIVEFLVSKMNQRDATGQDSIRPDGT